MMGVASVTGLGLMVSVKERQATEFLHCREVVVVAVVKDPKMVVVRSWEVKIPEMGFWGPEQLLGPDPYVKVNFFRPSEL